MIFDKDKKYINHYVALPPIGMTHLTVLTWNIYSDLSTNNIVAETIREQLTSKEEGWTKNQRVDLVLIRRRIHT